MRSLAIAILLAAPTLASAQRIEHVGRVTADTSYSTPPLTNIGDAHLVALSGMIPSEHSLTEYHVEVLDVRTVTTKKITTTREILTRWWGDANDHATDGFVPPSGKLVHWQTDHAGVAFYHSEFGRHRYAEVDAKSGKIGRAVELADGKRGELVTFIGTDPVRKAAWFAIADEGTHRVKLRRLDLDSLAVSDELTIKLRDRTSETGYETQRFFHHAPDFSRFAIVEYFEAGMNMSPGDVHVIDPIARTSFAVDAISTAYGVAFAPDHIYFGSCQTGEVVRLDIATKRYDKRVKKAGKRIHKLVITPNRQRMIVTGSTNKMTVLDLPSLANKSTKRHDPKLDDALTFSFGGETWTLDRKFVVTHDQGGKFSVGKLVDD